MSVVLGVNAVFHDPAAALVVDGEIVAACEDECIRRRKHGKSAVPFSTWELRSAVVHVDGTAPVQTVDRHEEPVVAAVLEPRPSAGRPARARQHDLQHRRSTDGRPSPRRCRGLRRLTDRRLGDRAVPGAPTPRPSRAALTRTT